MMTVHTKLCLVAILSVAMTVPAAAEEPAASAATETAEPAKPAAAPAEPPANVNDTTITEIPAPPPVAPAPVIATAQTVVAMVNGTAITVGHMLALREKLPAEYQSLPDDVLFKGILDQLVQQTALAQSRETALTLRDALNIDNDRRAYLAGAAVDAVAAGAVTDEALQAAYDARYASAAPSTEYKAAHILVATEEEAKQIKATIDSGADFAQVAMEKSTDGAAANGGDLGWFGQGMMVREFEDAVIGMEPGSVSDPVQTQFGWHLIRLEETRIAEAPPLADVREELAAEIRQKAVVAQIAALTDQAEISRTVEGIDPAVLRDQNLMQQ